MHVADRVDVDQEADEGDERDHDRRQRVELERRVDHELAGGDPGEVGLDGAISSGWPRYCQMATKASDGGEPDRADADDA